MDINHPNSLETQIRSRASSFAVFGDNSIVNNTLDMLISDRNTTFDKVSDFLIYTGFISKAYYDENSSLVFKLFLPYEDDFNKYIYGIGLIDSDSNLLSITKAVKTLKISGIGGMYVYKISLSNNSSEPIFNNHLECPSNRIAMKGGAACKAITNCEYCSYCR